MNDIYKYFDVDISVAKRVPLGYRDFLGNEMYEITFLFDFKFKNSYGDAVTLKKYHTEQNNATYMIDKTTAYFLFVAFWLTALTVKLQEDSKLVFI